MSSQQEHDFREVLIIRHMNRVLGQYLSRKHNISSLTVKDLNKYKSKILIKIMDVIEAIMKPLISFRAHKNITSKIYQNLLHKMKLTLTVIMLLPFIASGKWN